MGSAGTHTNSDLLSLFKQFDANDDGLIDESEFEAMLARLGWASTAEVLSMEFAAIDGNDDGKVELQEFVDWWEDRN